MSAYFLLTIEDHLCWRLRRAHGRSKKRKKDNMAPKPPMVASHFLDAGEPGPHARVQDPEGRPCVLGHERIIHRDLEDEHVTPEEFRGGSEEAVGS